MSVEEDGNVVKQINPLLESYGFEDVHIDDICVGGDDEKNEADTDEFKSQFIGKQVNKFEYTKTGSTKDSEIDALSGATITTSAVTNAVNAALRTIRFLTTGGAQ